MTRPAPLLVLAIIAGLAAVPPAGAAAQAPQAPVRYVVAPDGNEARYLVREQLLGRDLPNDAVGVTSIITGAVTLNAAGEFVVGASRIEVDLSDLTSDSDRRDNYIKRRTLDTENHPVAVFVPHRAIGLDGPLPSGGEVSFRIGGEMTVRGVTRDLVWDATARRVGDAIVGTATTRFPFSRFDLEIPRVRSVLSVDDDIRLEYDFRLVPDA